MAAAIPTHVSETTSPDSHEALKKGRPKPSGQLPRLAVASENSLTSLLRHREILSSMLEHSPDIHLRADSQGRLMYANARSEVLFGVKPQFLLGRSFRHLGLPEAFCHFWENLIDRTLEARTPLERDFSFQTHDGIRHFQVRATPEALESDASDTVIATIRESTRQRSQDSEMVNAGQRLLYHMNNSPLAVMEFDAQGRCLAWNHRAEEIFGQPRHQGGEPLTNCLPLIYPEDRAHFQAIHDKLHNGRQASAFAAARFIHRNGAVAHGEWYLSSLLDEEGACRSILCFLNDVTDRENAEQQLLRMNVDLEKIILTRTETLRRINDDLQQEIVIRKRLEGELVQISEREHRRLGHDLHDGLCQELAGIHFSVQAIQKRLNKRSAVQGHFTAIIEAIRRSIEHTRRLSRGLAPMELENGDLLSALTELAADTESLFQIECAFEPASCEARFDFHICSNLYRIAQEAIQNAIKHGKASRIRIALDCRDHEGVMTITDNGNGIDKTKPSDAEGNGMGLSIMKHRAELIRGTCTVLSHNGGGTRVHCVFQI